MSIEVSLTETRSLPDRFRDPNGTPGEVFVVAHRGLFLDDGMVVLPENSVSAIDQAREIGCDMVEVDVHFTSDGTAVVIHDPTLDRTTTGTGVIASLSYKDVCNAQLINPRNNERFDSYVPTLEEVFNALGDQMMINVELKTGLSAIPKVAEIAAQAGVSHQLTVKSNLKDATQFHRVTDMIAQTPHPVDFIPVIVDSRDGFEGFAKACEILKPNCIECVVDIPTNDGNGYNLLSRRGITPDGGPLFSLQARRIAAEQNLRLFVNTLYVQPEIGGNTQWNGGRNCELGQITPDAVYGFWISHGATVIQSDYAAFVIEWLYKSGFRNAG